jgi:histidinol-phosphate aminotransferase
VPSEANFVMVEFPHAAQAEHVVEDLLTQGVIVRPLKAFGLPQSIRISTGTDEDGERCLAAMRRTAQAAKV